MSYLSRTLRRPVQRSGRIIGRFNVTRAVAWGQPDLGDMCVTTTNTIIYVWKGIVPTFNLFLIICNTNSDRAQPDMITIDLQDHTLYPGFGTSAFMGYNADLSAGLCLIFGDQAQDSISLIRGILAQWERGQDMSCATEPIAVCPSMVNEEPSALATVTPPIQQWSS
ncbi:hypothetical protein GSI_00243 [Ganoderma sinense ZZ0214-1]|uniref:Uncharacterized protein n=1 Tax=Ganoderma sinense ZZ0214-1 TaxID=1077348 RepID=A0A2G8SS28_9APHY|nr:hypothetical protein GSI_00243 [Ganoderma sinense ZZ0214-1]